MVFMYLEIHIYMQQMSSLISLLPWACIVSMVYRQTEQDAILA